MAAEFECAGCGRHIVAVGVEAPPTSGLCGGCQIIGAERNRAFQNYEDGDITEAEFRRRYEAAPAPAWLAELERRRRE